MLDEEDQKVENEDYSKRLNEAYKLGYCAGFDYQPFIFMKDLKKRYSVKEAEEWQKGYSHATIDLICNKSSYGIYF